MYFYCYDYVFSLYAYVWLPWLRFFHVFSSVVSKCQGRTCKDGAGPVLFLIFVLFCVFFVLFYVFLCCSIHMYCLFCVILWIVCVYMCTELLPLGGYPFSVKYIISLVFVRYPVTLWFSIIFAYGICKLVLNFVLCVPIATCLLMNCSG